MKGDCVMKRKRYASRRVVARRRPLRRVANDQRVKIGGYEVSISVVPEEYENSLKEIKSIFGEYVDDLSQIAKKFRSVFSPSCTPYENKPTLYAKTGWGPAHLQVTWDFVLEGDAKKFFSAAKSIARKLNLDLGSVDLEGEPYSEVTKFPGSYSGYDVRCFPNFDVTKLVKPEQYSPEPEAAAVVTMVGMTEEYGGDFSPSTEGAFDDFHRFMRGGRACGTQQDRESEGYDYCFSSADEAIEAFQEVKKLKRDYPDATATVYFSVDGDVVEEFSF